MDLVSSSPFAVGIDRHSSPGFYYTNNPDRFPGPGTRYREHSEADSHHNDIANQVICRMLANFGMDAVFASEADHVARYLKDSYCRLVFFHAHIKEMGDTTQLLVTRLSVLSLVFLYNGTLPAASPDYFRLVDGATSLYEADDETMALVKPAENLSQDIRILVERALKKVG